MLKITADSHTDHGLTEHALAWIESQFADRDGFFIATVDLPEDLGPLTCALYGPIMGDPEVSENDVIHGTRGTRAWESRLIERHARLTRKLTVIAGPHGEDPCILYTAFGGPLAPQEPGDPGCKDVAASRVFWSKHALATLPYDPEFKGTR